MKRLILVASVMFLGVSLSFAATSLPTPKAVKSFPTRVAMPKAVVTPNPAMRNVNMRMMEQMRDISRAVHSGKISKDQAKTLREQVKAIRKQQLDFMKLNGKRDMTPDQVSQINQALDANSKSIP